MAKIPYRPGPAGSAGSVRVVATLASAVLLVAGCGAEPADSTGADTTSSPTTGAPPAGPGGEPAPTNDPAVTTTGLIPPGDPPTVGARPPADNLPPPAEPEGSPPAAADLSGRQVPVGDAPEGIVVDGQTRTVAVATRNPNELVLLDADTGEITERTPLPGFGRHLQLARPGGPVLVPVESADALVRVSLPDGGTESEIITGTFPHDASETPGGALFVANELGGTVTVLRGEDIEMVFTDSVQPAGMAPVGELMGMLDVRKNDLTVYDADNLTIVGSVPAGAGPTHLVADRSGRFIAADTRGNAVRVFDTTPAEIASVPQDGGPYGIAYDPVRDVVWVASSGINEVIGYSMTDDEPREVARVATVQNPYTVGVDPNTGRLFVTGLTAGVVHIIESPL